MSENFQENYKNKYLIYKNKYLKLKNQLGSSPKQLIHINDDSISSILNHLRIGMMTNFIMIYLLQ